MNKRERVIAAFQGKEVDHVPVCMWQHVPSEFWDNDDQFVQCQLDAYKNTDVDFVKLSADKYFCWPAPVLDGITNAMNVNLGQILRDGEGQGGLCAAVRGVATSRT